MTDTKTNEDLREKILSECDKEYVSDYGFIPTKEALLNALDEYFEKRAKELLKWMSDKRVDCGLDWEMKNPNFSHHGVDYTLDELFENFL